MLNCGDTFYAGETEDDEPHLSVIITPPSEGEVVTVSITTRRRKSEALVCLNVGDHPFIKHESVVAYAYSRTRSVDDIESAVQSGNAILREPVAPALLKRIRMGLRDSDFTPNGVRYLYCSLQIEE